MCRREGRALTPCLIDGEAIVCDESSLAMFELTHSRLPMLPPWH
jgi:hypothetical protein